MIETRAQAPYATILLPSPLRAEGEWIIFVCVLSGLKRNEPCYVCHGSNRGLAPARLMGIARSG
jgi:hypothetical protein